MCKFVKIVNPGLETQELKAGDKFKIVGLTKEVPESKDFYKVGAIGKVINVAKDEVTGNTSAYCDFSESKEHSVEDHNWFIGEGSGCIISIELI